MEMLIEGGQQTRLPCQTQHNHFTEVLGIGCFTSGKKHSQMVASHQNKRRQCHGPQPVMVFEMSQLVCYSEVDDIGGWLQKLQECTALIGLPTHCLPSQGSLGTHNIFRALKQDGSVEALNDSFPAGPRTVVFLTVATPLLNQQAI